MKLLLHAVLLICTVYVAHPSPIQEELRLIKTSEEKAAEWMTQDQIWELIGKHENFIDVTDVKIPAIQEEVDTKAIPTTIRFQSTVEPLLELIDGPRIEEFVTAFSSYHTRYYTSTTGLASQQWLLNQVRESIVGYPGTASVREFAHSFQQSSIIATIQGSDSNLSSEVIVIGAHQDSVNRAGSSLVAPGADDNASGSVVTLETLRILIAAGFIPKRTIEFHWYAAEEVGLRGSADIAQTYGSGVRTNVIAMMNLDVPGYSPAGTTNIGIYTDHTNAALNAFLRLVTDAYLTFGWVNRTCGYGCSDHVSWTNQGYPSSMPAELTLHPQMHTANDNLANVGFTQLREFVKLAVGYAVEIAEPY